jgi:hypothetical protein
MPSGSAPHVEQPQFLGVPLPVQAGKRVRAEKLGKDLGARKLLVARMLAENPFGPFRNHRPEDLHALPQLGVLRGELIQTGGGQVELVAAGAEAVPTEVTIPVPVEVRAVVLLERDAAPVRAILAARDFRIVQQDAACPTPKPERRYVPPTDTPG